MCKNRQEAETNCLIVYGDTNIAEPDFRPDGHYYHAQHDLVWVVHPMDDAGEDGHDGPGVTGVRDGAEPICVLAARKQSLPHGMVATPPAQPMTDEISSAFPKFVNDFSWRNIFKKPK